MKDTYMWNAGNILCDMRLLIEGAVILFENDALPLARLAREGQELEAYTAFNTIGSALYGLQQKIRDLQEAHEKEVQRQLEANT